MNHPLLTGWTVNCPDLNNKCIATLPANQDLCVQKKPGERIHTAAISKNHTRITSYTDSGLTIIFSGQPTYAGRSTGSFSPINCDDQFKKIIADYKKNGYHFLRDINGSFSIALFDFEKQITILAIDRMGIEQMHYYSAAGQLAFSNSLQMISSLPHIGKEILPQAVYNYFYFHCIPSPATIFKDIYKLKPAEVLIFKNGAISSDRYWTPSFNERASGDLKSDLLHSMDATVQDLSRDTNTGTFLSGGTDSSTLAGLLKKYHPGDAPAFSIGFEEQGYDEMGYAEIAVRKFGNKHFKYYVTFDDVRQLLDEIPRIYEEPFGNSSVVPTYAAAKFAKENGVDHLLGGDGGDELFGGNERYITQKLFNFYGNVPKWIRAALIEPIFRNAVAGSIPGAKKVKSYIEQAKIPMPLRMQTYNVLHTQAPSAIFDSYYYSAIDSNNPITLLSDTYNEVSGASLLNKMLYLDWKFTLADNDIRKVNTMCNAAGVNVSYPFLDNRVVDSSIKIPSNLKIKRMRLRSFYKDTYSEFLPPEIIAKPKHGFGLPFGVWLKKDIHLQNTVYEALTNLKTRAMFQNKFIDDLIQKHQSEHAAYYGTFVWVLAVLELWLDSHS